MPTTINGIGTHYYGKKDVASRTGSCQHCGVQGTLQSYTTRLWFVVIFVPIVPLKRLRLLDVCPSCRRHWAVNPEQYEMSRQLAVSGALEKYRDHPSVESGLNAHVQLLSFHMHQEADKFRGSLIGKFPQSAELLAGVASHLEQMGRWNEATPLYERAFELKSELPEIRHGLAWRRINENELDQAYDLLDYLRQPGAGQTFNLGPLETLAGLYQKQSNHERVLEICEHLLREVPAAAEHHAFRKLIAQSERALRQSSSILPAKSFSVSGLFDPKRGTHSAWVRWTAFAAVVGFLFLFGMVALNEYRRTHRTLYVLNGFAQPISVSVDSGPLTTVGERVPFSLSEGRHQVAITGPVNKQAEVKVETEYWSRFTHSPIWILNIEKLAPVTQSTIHYSAIPQPSQSHWLRDSELTFIPHVDYVFQQPPQSLKVEGANQTITKVHVGMAPLPPATVFMGFQKDDVNDAAMTYAEGFLNRNPNDSSLLRLYYSRSEEGTDEQRVSDFLKAGLWRKPYSVPWHRTYTALKSVAADEAKMAAEYDERLQKEDKEHNEINYAMLLYLRGRVTDNRKDRLLYFQRANEKKPGLGWPDYGLAFDAANRGEWQDAKGLCDKSLNTLGSDPSFRALRHYVSIATGDTDYMEADYRNLSHSQDYVESVNSVFYLADVLASKQSFDVARQATRQWLAQMAGPAAPAETMSAFDLMLDYVCGSLDNFRENNQQPKPAGLPDYLFHSWLAIGDPDSALKVEGAEKLLKESPANLAVGLAYSLQGNHAEAEQWLSRACDRMRESENDRQRAALLLERDHAPTDEELNEVELSIPETSLLLATLAQRFPDRKSELNQRAKRLNVSRMPPYLLVKTAIETP